MRRSGRGTTAGLSFLRRSLRYRGRPVRHSVGRNGRKHVQQTEAKLPDADHRVVCDGQQAIEYALLIRHRCNARSMFVQPASRMKIILQKNPSSQDQASAVKPTILCVELLLAASRKASMPRGYRSLPCCGSGPAWIGLQLGPAHDYPDDRCAGGIRRSSE